MAALTSNHTIIDAVQIPYTNADEAFELMTTELSRFLKLIEMLGPEEWEKPTACTEWNVRDILAHQAGGFKGATGYREMFRQVRNRPESGQLMEDAINAFQLRERAGNSPEELISEIRAVGPVAAHNWAYRFRLLHLVSIPHRDAGRLSLRHLNWVIHSRDTWMHRLDICRATGRVFEQSEKQDARIIELIMMDVADTLARKTEGTALVFEFSGLGGGVWKIGQGEPAATISMDVLEFAVFSSGRTTFEQARPLMTITGDIARAEEALRQILVVF